MQSQNSTQNWQIKWQIKKSWAIAIVRLVTLGVASQLMLQVAAIACEAPGSVSSNAVSTDAVITAQQRNQVRPSPLRLPPIVALRVQRELTQRFNIARRDISIVSFSRETWSDSCLGLAAPNERCAMATVDGWRIELTNGQQNWAYRTDLRAQIIKLENGDTAELPPQVVEQLFNAIARDANVPLNTLKVVESRPTTFDGCMGIFEPGLMCTQIAISGYQVIVMGDRQSWVYHVTQSGSQIVQNTTASGSSSQITPSFFPDEAQSPMPPENVVFRMMVSGGLTGSTTETVLTSDGTLYRRSTGMQPSANSEPTVIKRLSPQQLQRFQQLLQQQRFPNLNGMRYLTSAAFADYPTTTMQAMGSTVEYIDLEEAGLPQSLQAVIQAWKQL